MLGQTNTGISQKPERQPYEFDGALPVVFGRARVAGQLIEAPWNFEQFSTGDHGQDPADIYSLAYCFCVGPVDRLIKFFINGKPVLWQDIDRGTEDSILIDDVAWGGPGQERGLYARFYWGREDQAGEPFLRGTPFTHEYIDRYRTFGNRYIDKRRVKDLASAPNYHPRYPGICYMVFFNLDTGYPLNPRARGPQLPTVEAEVYRKPKGITVSTDHHNYGVSPISTIYEAMTKEWWGMGLGDTVTLSDWQTEAYDLRDNGVHTLTGQQTGINFPAKAKGRADRLLAELAEYYDGFFSLREGKLVPGHFPNRIADLPGTVPELNIHDMDDFPEIEPPDADEITTQVAVKYTPVEEFLEEAEITERNPTNVMETGLRKATSINAPYAIRYELAIRLSLRWRPCRNRGRWPMITRTLRTRGNCHRIRRLMCSSITGPLSCRPGWRAGIGPRNI